MLSPSSLQGKRPGSPGGSLFCWDSEWQPECGRGHGGCGCGEMQQCSGRQAAAQGKGSRGASVDILPLVFTGEKSWLGGNMEECGRDTELTHILSQRRLQGAGERGLLGEQIWQMWGSLITSSVG